MLAVKDTGVGIPADVLPTIFDLFVQSERSLDRSQGGLGIGLTLVRRLAELHGGTVNAASDGAGMGSTFTVRLPTIPAPIAKARDQVSAVPAEYKPRKVLVVEDNDDLREMLGILLAQDGHEVRTANDGPGGLEAALTFGRILPYLTWACRDLTGMHWRAASAPMMRANRFTSSH